MVFDAHFFSRPSHVIREEVKKKTSRGAASVYPPAPKIIAPITNAARAPEKLSNLKTPATPATVPASRTEDTICIMDITARDRLL